MLRDNIHRRSRLQENKAAKSYGGMRTPGSGNQWFAKADIKTPDWLIECKSTTRASYGLKAETFLTLKRQSLIENKLPLLEIELPGITCVVLDKEDFLILNGTPRPKWHVNGGQCIT